VTVPPPPTPEADALRQRIAARADEVRALSIVPARNRLPAAPLADVLLWGLFRDSTDPVMGVLRTVRLDLDVLAACIDVDRDTLEAGIEATARRVDVAVELLRRLHRDPLPTADTDP
jgi:hypothetical protein